MSVFVCVFLFCLLISGVCVAFCFFVFLLVSCALFLFLFGCQCLFCCVFLYMFPCFYLLSVFYCCVVSVFVYVFLFCLLKSGVFVVFCFLFFWFFPVLCSCFCLGCHCTYQVCVDPPCHVVSCMGCTVGRVLALPVTIQLSVSLGPTFAHLWVDMTARLMGYSAWWGHTNGNSNRGGPLS